MANAIIVDDEAHCVSALMEDLKKYCPQIHITGTCNSAKEAMLTIKKQKPDLVFLDIEMPWMNGFEMLEIMEEINFDIIFVTAYDKFAAKAFRLSAIDYLLKPIDSNDLKEAIEKYFNKKEHKHKNIKIENLLHNIKQPEHQQKIALPNRDGYEFVALAQILYIEARGSYTNIVLTNNNKILVSKTLGDIEELLPEEIFLRIHHSTLINQNHVTHFIRTDGSYVIMTNGEKLIVSRARKDEVLQRLGLKS